MKKLFLLFSILAFAISNAQSIDEIFDYNLGTLTGQGSWVEGGSFSGTGGTASRSVVTEALTYSNSGGSYELSGIGKSMLINIPTSVVTSNYYHNKPLSTSYSDGTVYMSFLMRVNTNISVSNQEAIGFSSGVNAGSRVLIGATTSGFYKIGVIKGSTASVDYKYASLPRQLAVGTTYLIVLKYVFGTTPVASVYINPIIGGAEPSPEISDSTSTTNRTPLNGLWSRASGSTVAQNINISSLRVSTTWTDAVKPALVIQSQTISFPTIPTKGTCQADFGPGATASSNLLVSYESSNTAVASIINGNIHIVGAGTATITASQAGNGTYSAATNVTQSLTVTAVTAPTASVQNFCSSNRPTVSSLIACEAGLQCYATENEVGALATTTSLVAGTYYVSKTLNTCESPRIPVTVSLNCNNLKIILKLDDFYCNNGSSTSIPTLAKLRLAGIKAAIGFVADRNDATALSVYSPYLNETNSNGDKLFEVWHHGFDHESPEFEVNPYSYQKPHFEDANQLILDGLRVQMHTFAAPFNATDTTTNTVVSENLMYKVTMFQDPAPNVSTGILNLTNRVNMESATGVPSLSTLITNYDIYKNSYTDYMVLQGHPYAWTTQAKLDEFQSIINYLNSKGVEFVLPYDYYLGLHSNQPRPNTSQTISFSALPNKRKVDPDFDPGATSTSGLTVTYNSSNPAVATIVNGYIHLVGSGTTIITASQIGDATYKSANYVSQTLTVTSIEFRSLASGNWNTSGTWQVSDYDGNWTTSTSVPTASNNVFIQNGHTVTVNTAEVNCYDLQINTSGVLTIGTNIVNVNGKIRAYTGPAEISALNGEYLGTNTTTLANTMITTSAPGVLKFVGSSRNITNLGEWNGLGTSNNVTFALNSGAIGTLQTAIKFRVITIASGTVSTDNTINVGSSTTNGLLTINSGAKLLTSRTYSTAGSQAIAYSSSSKCDTVTIDSGGILELTGATPVIDCTTFNNNGTVVYSGKAQNLLSIGAGLGTPITTYTNLTISGVGAKTLPTNTNITVSGALNFTDTGINMVTGTNTLTLGTAGSIVGAGTGWVVGNLIKQTDSNASPSFAFAIGDATNYKPITLTFTGNTSVAGSIVASTSSGDHAQLSSSDLFPNKSVNRTWTLTNSNLAGFTNYSVTFNYNSADNDAGNTPTYFAARLYNGSSWSNLTTFGTPTLTSMSVTGLTSFGDFAIGEYCANPTSGGTIIGTQSICYGGNPFVFSNDTLPSGNAGDLVYQWQSSTNNITFSDIASANSSNYTAPSGLTVTTYYKRLSRVSCKPDWTGATASNVVIVTVNTTAAPTSTNQTFSSNKTVADLVATGTNLQWYSVATNGSPLATTTPLSTNTYYVSQTLNSCESTRAAISVTIYPQIFWTGTNNINWSDSGNWSTNSLPTSFSDVVISSGSSFQPTISTDVLINSLTIQTGETLTISTGSDLNVTGVITNVGTGTMVVENNANLIQTNNVANIGNITVNRDSSPLLRLDHTLWSSPVTGSQTLLQFSPNTLTNRFYTYTTSSNTYTAISETSTFTAGKGVAIRASNTHSSTVPTAFSGTFTGVPNNGNISFTLATDATNGYNYNLVGNPYPSTIDVTAFLDGNRNVAGTVYFYTHSLTMDTAGLFPQGTNYSSRNSSGYTVSTHVNGDLHPIPSVPNGTIQVGQGFIVKSETGGAVTFTNAMRTGNNDNQLLRTTEIEKHRIWLNLKTDTGTDINQMMVGYIEGATQGVDSDFDGLLFGCIGSSLSSKLDGANYGIQGRSLPFASNDVVPLAFKASAVGNYMISLTNTDGLFAGSQDIFVRDNLMGIDHNIKVSPYTFTSDAGIFDSRFELVYTQALGIPSTDFTPNSVIVYKNTDWFHVNTKGITMKEIQVYDVLGRLIFKQSDINATATVLKGLTQTNEVLFLKIISEENAMVTVKVIN